MCATRVAGCIRFCAALGMMLSLAACSEKRDTAAPAESSKSPDKPAARAPTPSPLAESAKQNPPAVAESAKKLPVNANPPAKAAGAKAAVPKDLSGLAKALASAVKPNVAPAADDKAAPQLVMLSEADGGGYDSVQCLAVLPGGESFLAAGKSLATWEFRGKAPIKERSEFLEDLGFNHKVKSTALSPDAKLVGIGCDDGTLRIWDLGNEKLVARVDAHKDGVNGVAFGLDNRIATCGFDDQIRVWNAADGNPIDSWKVDDRSQAAIAFSPDGKRLVSCGQKATIWDVKEKKSLHSLTEGFGRVADVAFSPDGKTIACGEMASRITLWDVESGQLKSTLTGHQGPLRLVAFRPDGEQLASAGDEYTVRIWDVKSGKLIQTISTETSLGTETPNDIAWSTDGKRLAIVTTEGKIRIWGPKEELGVAERPTTKPTEDIPQAEDKPRAAVVAVAKTGDARPTETEPAKDDGPAPGHVVEAADIVDFTKIPWPKGTDGIVDSVTQFNYDGPGDVETCRKFYHDYFTSNGWKDITKESRVGESEIFEKNGYRVYIYVSKSHSGESGVSIYALNHGNFDVRRLPKPKEAIEPFENAMNNNFFTSLSVKEAADLYKNELPKLGWHLTREIDSSGIRTDWIQNGVHLLVSVGSAPAKGGMTVVQCSTDMVREELPIPPDATIEDYDEYPDLGIKLSTKSDLTVTADWLSGQMKRQRWKGIRSEQNGEKSTSLYFKRGRQSASIVVQAADGGGSKVEMSAHSTPTKEMLEAAERAQQRERDRESKAKEIAKEALKVAISTADFPIPDDAFDIDRSKFTKNIQFKVKGTIDANLKFYREKLKGWKEDKKEEMIQPTFGQIAFTNDAATIRIRIIGTDDPKVFRAYIDGTGLRIEGE